jgi:hypothetical protein
MKTKTKIKMHIFNMAFLNKAIGIFILIFGAMYIFSVNSMSTQGYTLQDLKNKLNELNIKNEENELHIMTLESLQYISTRAKEIKMVKADNVEYFSVNNDVVAKK